MIWDTAAKVIVSVASAVVLAVLAFAWRTILDAILFVRAEYNLTAERNSESPFSCTWDVAWEGYRLTFKVENISDDKLEGVVFARHDGKEKPFPQMFPGDVFEPLFDGISVKIASIIRTRPASGPRMYALRFVLRRKRRFGR